MSYTGNILKKIDAIIRKENIRRLVYVSCQDLEKLGSIRDRMCATAKIALNPEIIAFQ